jgi:hypothetical protein
MRKPHQIGVCRGGIDHQEVDRRPDFADGAFESGQLRGFVVLEPCALGAWDEAMQRKFQCDLPMVGPNAPVFDIARQAPLIGVEIDGSDPLAAFQGATARCMAIVVLPEPPFSLPMTTTCGDPAPAIGVAYSIADFASNQLQLQNNTLRSAALPARFRPATCDLGRHAA